jgi:drug/metabolite transporter (DMT)-like permease
LKLKNFSTAGFFHLMVVYIVWGSTYLAIRLAVRPGAGFTPFMMAGSRAIIAGLILLGWAILSNQPLRISWRAFIPLALSALMLWLGGNGLVTWGSQYADSALTALIIASVPVWTAGIEAGVDRRLPVAAPGRRLVDRHCRHRGFELPGAAGWRAFGPAGARRGCPRSSDLVSRHLIQSRKRPPLSPVVASSYSMLVGGIGFGILALLNKEPVPAPTTEAWLAWGYLVIFGSILAFTSYTQALRLLPTQIVTTYSYVNPIIAVLLGWLVLREQITLWTVVGLCWYCWASPASFVKIPAKNSSSSSMQSNKEQINVICFRRSLICYTIKSAMITNLDTPVEAYLLLWRSPCLPPHPH